MNMIFKVLNATIPFALNIIIKKYKDEKKYNIISSKPD